MRREVKPSTSIVLNGDYWLRQIVSVTTGITDEVLTTTGKIDEVSNKE